jgi:hypothetical protein
MTHRTSSPFLLFIAVALLALACKKDPPTTPSNVIAVAGTYTTRVAVIAERNNCGAVTAQDFPTTVTHAAGSRNLVLTHAGSTYAGTVETDGRFSTPAANYPFPDADYTISISGQFSTTGFTATVELVKRAGGVTCTYAVGWVGTKQGSANTIPG